MTLYKQINFTTTGKVDSIDFMTIDNNNCVLYLHDKENVINLTILNKDKFLQSYPNFEKC